LGRSRLAFIALLAAIDRLVTFVLATLEVRAPFAVLADVTVLDALADLMVLTDLAAVALRFGGAAFFTGTGGGRLRVACLDAVLTGCAFFARGFAAFGATAFLVGAAATLFAFGGAGLLDLGVTVILPGL
jgi:hypothetical protein